MYQEDLKKENLFALTGETYSHSLVCVNQSSPGGAGTELKGGGRSLLSNYASGPAAVV